MNLLLLLPEDERTADTVEVTGRRFDHLLNTLKIAERGSCRAGRLNGLIGTARLLELDEKGRRLTLRPDLTEPPPPPSPVRLVMALPRPKTLRKVLQAAIAGGIKKICFINSFKVDKSYWSTPLLQPESWRQEAVLALEQGVDTVLPEILVRPRFKPFVEDEFREFGAGSRILAAHPGAAMACPADLAEPVTLCLGPEGGFTDYELAMLCRHGAEPVSLGRRILRTEFAVAALLGRLGLLLA